ncbi:MAG: pentapeptide repeat-containing protein [Bacteroidetes bacterium]|nr:pentapeptide repeat-containing protein [Bacteroidota bacterium]
MLNSKSLGYKIATARKKINLSQADLAQQVSISSQAVGKWERGESMPDITTLNRLADIFGVDLNYFSDSAQNDNIVTPTSGSADEPRIPNKVEEPVKKFELNWDMSQGNWTDADFSGLKNLKEKFSSSNMKNCKFMHSDLSGLVLGKNNIEQCDFSFSDLSSSKIQSSNLSKNQFVKCSFIDAELYKNNIEKCNFTEADFSAAKILGLNFESNDVKNAVWKLTIFNNTNLSNIIFEGTFEDCHFENCSFYGVKFQNATILNTFFKNNDRFKKVKFINCNVDKITYAFLKNNMADMTGVTLIN